MRDINKLAERVAELTAVLRFVERWAVHHAGKRAYTQAEVLSAIQHHPEIAAITASYADGVVPDTRNPWQELREAEAECDKLRARIAELEATKLEARNTWRVVCAGRVHTTHIEREVHEAIKLGYKVRRLYSYEVNEWRDEA